MSAKAIHVKDKFQDYSYVLSAPIGKRFDEDFHPDLTPKQMLRMGVFGGEYFSDQPSDIPKDWFKRVKLSDKSDPKLNYYKVSASQPLKVWQQKGWIDERDPRGWFQWYCRYYMGRREPEYDEWQIKRWKAITRHIGQIKANCMPGDINCRPRQRQTLLHWAYDSTKI